MSFLRERQKTNMIKVMHIITTLGPAGAENMLCRIAAGMDGTRFENEIVSLTGILDLAERMDSIGVRVRTLGMKKGIPNPLLVMRLAEWIRESKPRRYSYMDVSREPDWRSRGAPGGECTGGLGHSPQCV